MIDFFSISILHASYYLFNKTLPFLVGILRDKRPEAAA